MVLISYISNTWCSALMSLCIHVPWKMWQNDKTEGRCLLWFPALEQQAMFTLFFPLRQRESHVFHADGLSSLPGLKILLSASRGLFLLPSKSQGELRVTMRWALQIVMTERLILHFEWHYHICVKMLLHLSAAHKMINREIWEGEGEGKR